MKLARPPKAKGPAKRYSIRLPCMVNSSLNCWLERSSEAAGGARQLEADGQGHEPGQEEHDERGVHVVHPDHLVIGARHPLEEPGRALVVLGVVVDARGVRPERSCCRLPVLTSMSAGSVAGRGRAATEPVDAGDGDRRAPPWSALLLGAQPGLELGRRQGHHVEEHLGVVEAAELGALGPVDRRGAAR